MLDEIAFVTLTGCLNRISFFELEEDIRSLYSKLGRYWHPKWGKLDLPAVRQAEHRRASEEDCKASLNLVLIAEARVWLSWSVPCCSEPTGLLAYKVSISKPSPNIAFFSLTWNLVLEAIHQALTPLSSAATFKKGHIQNRINCETGSWTCVMTTRLDWMLVNGTQVEWLSNPPTVMHKSRQSLLSLSGLGALTTGFACSHQH